MSREHGLEPSGDKPEPIVPAPLGELVYMPPEYVCFADEDSQHTEGSCPHCVPAGLYDEVEETFLTATEED